MYNVLINLPFTISSMSPKRGQSTALPNLLYNIDNVDFMYI